MFGTVCPVSEISGLDIPRPGACATAAFMADCDPPGGESGGIGRLGHAGVTSRMSHDRAPTRRLSCRALPPRRVALLVIAPLTAAKSERHCRVLVAELPRHSSRRFPKPLIEW